MTKYKKMEKVSSFKSLYYKVSELEAFLNQDSNIDLIEDRELLNLMYNLDRVSDHINHFLTEKQNRVHQ